MKALVLDDHALVGQAIGGLLSEAWQFESLQVVTNLLDAHRWIEGHAPDLLVSDWDLGSGFTPESVVAALMEHNPSARLLLLTAHARTIVPPVHWQGITLAVVDKADGWMSLHQALLNWKCSDPVTASQEPACDLLALQHLPPRELRLLCELGKGLVNKEIAQSLALSTHTVATYRKSIAAKLGLSGSELVRAAVLARCMNLFCESSLEGN